MFNKRLLVFVSLAAITLALAPLTQHGGASPPLPSASFVPPTNQPASDTDALKVAIVRSWAGGGASAWAELNTEWPAYGTRPIQIDWTLASVSSFTLADLVATAADVVVLSDPAGDNGQFSAAEIAALGEYAKMGHDLIGTYLVFAYSSTDNSGLQPLFGLDAPLVFDADPFPNQFRMLLPGDPLFAKLGENSWTSSGYPFTQTPTDFSWDPGDLAGATIVAGGNGFEAVITVYRQPTYQAIYISNMPEYFGSTLDKQLLYNAITYP